MAPNPICNHPLDIGAFDKNGKTRAPFLEIMGKGRLSAELFRKKLDQQYYTVFLLKFPKAELGE
jgi:hypothetical protein